MTGTDGIDFMCELMRKREQTEHGWKRWLGKENHVMLVPHTVGITQQVSYKMI